MLFALVRMANTRIRFFFLDYIHKTLTNRAWKAAQNADTRSFTCQLAWLSPCFDIPITSLPFGFELETHTKSSRTSITHTQRWLNLGGCWQVVHWKWNSSEYSACHYGDAGVSHLGEYIPHYIVKVASHGRLTSVGNLSRHRDALDAISGPLVWPLINKHNEFGY